MDKRPNRKSPRLKNYDYSSVGAYSLTICAMDMKHIFGRVEYNPLGNTMNLSDVGMIVDEIIQSLPGKFPGFEILTYAILPNHLHILICKENEMIENGHSVSDFVKSLKALATIQIRKSYSKMEVWKDSFHDHIIRDDFDLENQWFYIEGNVAKWEKDLFYKPKDEL